MVIRRDSNYWNGQGYIQTTPIQLCLMTAQIVTEVIRFIQD